MATKRKAAATKSRPKAKSPDVDGARARVAALNSTIPPNVTNADLADVERLLAGEKPHSAANPGVGTRASEAV